MRQLVASIAGIFVVAVALFPGSAEAKESSELQSGDVIDFLLPAPEQASQSVFITGGKVLTIDTTGCPPSVGQHPVQHYTLVDPAGTRSPRSGGIVLLTTDPVRPGTPWAN